MDSMVVVVVVYSFIDSIESEGLKPLYVPLAESLPCLPHPPPCPILPPLGLAQKHLLSQRFSPPH